MIQTILHVNKETRHEALKVYKASFKNSGSNWYIKVPSPIIIYFNPAIDTIYLDYPTLKAFQEAHGWNFPAEICSVTSLALEGLLVQSAVESDPLDMKRNIDYRGPLCLKNFKDLFSGLKNFYIVHEMDLLGQREFDFVDVGTPNDDAEIELARYEFRLCWDRYYDYYDIDSDEEEEEQVEELQGDADYPLPMVKSIKRYRNMGTDGGAKKDGWFEFGASGDVKEPVTENEEEFGVAGEVVNEDECR